MPEVEVADNQVAPADTATDAYKGLQRKLEAARKREKALVEQNLAQTEQAEKLAAIESTQVMILQMLQKTGMVDAVDIKAVTAPTGDAAKESRRDIAAKLFDAEAQWDDERLEGARAAWRDGKYAEASKLVASALGAPETDMAAAVEAEVQKRLQQRTGIVDTGTSTAAAPSPALTNAAALAGQLSNADGSLNREFWAKNKQSILDNVRSGKLRLAAP